MFSELIRDPMAIVAVFLICCAISVASLLNSMKQGGSTFGIFAALLFAGAAAWLSPTVFKIINGTPL